MSKFESRFVEIIITPSSHAKANLIYFKKKEHGKVLSYDAVIIVKSRFLIHLYLEENEAPSLTAPPVKSSLYDCDTM